MYNPTAQSDIPRPRPATLPSFRAGKTSPAEPRGVSGDVRSPTSFHTISGRNSPGQGKKKRTYKRQPAVTACCNLGLVGGDEDLGGSGGTAAAVAGRDPVVRPPHGLLVDELDGGIRPGLWTW